MTLWEHAEEREGGGREKGGRCGGGGKEEGGRREGGVEGRKGGAANLICHEKRVKGSKTSA